MYELKWNLSLIFMRTLLRIVTNILEAFKIYATLTFIENLPLCEDDCLKVEKGF